MDAMLSQEKVVTDCAGVIGLLEGRIAHSVPGRVRIALVEIPDALSIERSVLAIPGVHSVKANALTGTVLVQYEERHVDQLTVLRSVCQANAGTPVSATESDWSLPPCEACGSVSATPKPTPVPPAKRQKPRSKAVVKIGIELLAAVVLADVGAVVSAVLIAAIANRLD